MKRFACILFLWPFWLSAADSWQSKPYTEWTGKDIRKILTNSGWAHEVSVEAGQSAGGVGRAGESGSRPQGADPSVGPGIMVPSGAGASNPGGAAAPETGAGQTLRLTIRWQSALPVKQALVRVKYGSDAPGEAKRFLEQEDSTYVIAVSGLPSAFATNDGSKAAVKQRTSLSIKGGDPLQPSDIVIAPQGPLVDEFFLFPKSRPFQPDDKDIEFTTALGALKIKCAFHLKEMFFKGALAL